MNKYQLACIRYSPDRASGEFLNVGVVVFEPETGLAECKIVQSIERMSAAFPGLDHVFVRQWLKGFSEAVARHNIRFEQGSFTSPPASVETLLTSIVPDKGTAIWFSDQRESKGDSLAEVAAYWHESLVMKYVAKRDRDRKDDEDVFKEVSNFVKQRGIEVRWTPYQFKAKGDPLECDHVFFNGRPNVVETASLDYASKDPMGNKIDRLIGKTTRLGEVKEIGEIFVIVGTPGRSEMKAEAKARTKSLRQWLPANSTLYCDESDCLQEIAQKIKGLLTHD